MKKRKDKAATSAAAAAAGPAPPNGESHFTARKLARTGGCDETAGDPISRLPDAVLCSIISLLPTKDGGRTQAVSRRWRHLWRSAPLNLEVVDSVPVSAVSQIISQHPGPARRFCFPWLRPGDLYAPRGGWFYSQALTNLQELDISHVRRWPQSETGYPVLLSALRSASTLLVAKISDADFPNKIAPPMNFPLLKQLTLRNVSISGDVFDGLLSGCHSLESLLLSEAHSVGCLRVSLLTLRCIGFRGNTDGKAKLIIEDAPRLERLLVPFFYYGGCDTVRVIRAPKLEILGPFSLVFSNTLVFQGMSPVSPVNSMFTVKVLALRSSGCELHAVLNILRWFPCLEKLYVIFYQSHAMDKKNEPQFDPLHPIECLENHLKKVVLKSYVGSQEQVDFARFFVLNAEVLSKIEFVVHGDYNNESVSSEHMLLQLENRASRDVQFEFRSNGVRTDFLEDKHIHDLSVADPFRQP